MVQITGQDDLPGRLRSAGYTGSFIEHWLGRIIFHEAPFWVFTLAYTVFAILVLATWWYFPPRWIKRKRDDGSSS